MTLRMDRRRLLEACGSLALFAGLDRHARAWNKPVFEGSPFTLGVASGDPLPDGFVIWTRLAPQPREETGGMPRLVVPVRWEVASDAGFIQVVRAGESLARPELAHSVHVEVSGLQPARPYWYRFLVDGAGYSPAGLVRTAPAPHAMPARLRMAVAGCQAWPQGWFGAFRHLAQEPELDAVFHYGDYIYEGSGAESAAKYVILDAAGARAPRQHERGEAYMLSDYRCRYGQYKSDPDLIAAHAAAAFISSFDDHEIDNNWAGNADQDGTPAEVFALRRFAAMQAWYEHMPVRAAQFPRAGGNAMYRRLDYGRLLRLHVLDTRSHRSDQLCESSGQQACRAQETPDSTMLGAAQEAWLGEGLRNGARWNLLAQQVRLMPFVRREGDGRLLAPPSDTWDGYPAARARLVQAIDERGLSNVVVATGDAHVHNIGVVPLRDGELDGPAAATEFLCSSITSGGDGNDAVSPHLLNGSNPHQALRIDRRGYQTFDITAQQWRTDVKVMDQVQRPGGRISTAASFSVTPDRPALNKA